MPELHERRPCEPDCACDCGEAEEIQYAVEKIVARLRRADERRLALGAHERHVGGYLDVVAMVAEQAAGMVGAFANHWAHRAGN